MNYRQTLLQLTVALRTPLLNGHLDNTDSS